MFKRLFLLFTVTLGISQFASAQDQSLVPESKETGYYNTTELNLARGFLNGQNSWLFGLHTTNGFEFNKHISAGLGIGLEKSIHTNVFEGGLRYGSFFLPVYSDVRIYFGKGNVQPYFGQSVGYMFFLYQPGNTAQNDQVKQIGGILINPSFGIKTQITPKTAFNISIGYRLQEETIKDIPFYNGYDFDPYVRLYNITFTSHLLTLKTGLTF